MLDHEYKKLHDKTLRRSWPLTIISAIAAILTVLGIVSVLKYLGRDGVIIFAVVIPAAICALVFVAAAINGRKETVKEAVSTVMRFAAWWPK